VSDLTSPDGPLLEPVVYGNLLDGITALLAQARRAAARSVNAILTATYWEVGRRIVEFEQGGEQRAGYGEEMLRRLSRDLVADFGRGFGLTNLKLMRSFYLLYRERLIVRTPFEESRPAIGQTLSDLSLLAQRLPLSWSHYVRLLTVDPAAKRDFYEQEAVRGGWSVRQLDRQVNSMLYERLALSRQKGELLRQAEASPDTIRPEDEIRDPYVLEFLGLPEPHSERDLEAALIEHLAEFLLELGYGFAFVARQKRLQVGSESYYLDLLLYHRRLRCLVAIDLKLGKFTHADAGQMNLYLNYLAENETLGDEAPPIGLILCAEKDEAVAHYALGGLSHKVFASRYKLELPDPEMLGKEIEAERRRLESGNS
jgi:predicted nuclease of restriction endonuclease-like (RecB) superfamily